MNRKIKFRVWDNVGYMSPPFTLYDVATSKVQFTMGSPIMQFAGLRDKNGKEVYDGDLAIIDDNICEVRFGEFFTCGWEFKIINGLGCYPFHTFCKTFNSIGCKDFEIIGNVFENPELIAKK